MDRQFNGKVALVTGAASGKGFSTAKMFAEAGASVMLADVNRDAVGAAAAFPSAGSHRGLAGIAAAWRASRSAPAIMRRSTAAAV